MTAALRNLHARRPRSVRAPTAIGPAGRLSVLVTLDTRVGGEVVDGLEVVGCDNIGINPLVIVQAGSHVAHQVLDELRVVVGVFRHVLLVRAFQDAIELARGFALGNGDELLDPHVAAEPRGDGDVRALVVGAVVGDSLRARAQAGHRHRDTQPHLGVSLMVLADQAGAVIHETLDARHRRLLHHEEGKAHLDMAGVRFQPRGHGAQHAAEGFNRDLALGVQDLDETRHVRAFEVVRQADVHVESRDGVLLAGRAILDPHRVTDVLDADTVDRQPPRIGVRLHVLHFGDAGACDLGDEGGRVHGYESTGNAGRSLRSTAAGGAYTFPRLQRPPALDAGAEAG